MRELLGTDSSIWRERLRGSGRITGYRAKHGAEQPGTGTYRGDGSLVPGTDVRGITVQSKLRKYRQCDILLGGRRMPMEWMGMRRIMCRLGHHDALER